MPRTQVDPDEATLVDAINDLPSNKLKSFLRRLVRENQAAKTAATAALLVPKRTGGKRKAYETCKNCGEDYNVTKNDWGSCVYHEGEQEIDERYDSWADHDDICHGDPMSRELMNDPDLAERYMWSCCEEEMDSEGCVITRHVPVSSKKTKR